MRTMIKGAFIRWCCILAQLSLLRVASSEELQAFTLHVATSSVSSGSVSTAISTVTVWFNQYVYQCGITPSSFDTDYSCDAATSFIGCDPSSDPIGAKMLIENNDADAPTFSMLTITTDSGTYTVSGVCIDDVEAIGLEFPDKLGGDDTLCDAGYSQYAGLCIDNEAIHCIPPKQLIYFDTTSINTDIENAAWENAASLSYTVETCSPEVLAASDACFNAVTVQDATFNAPRDGIISGIRLVHSSGAVSCNSGDYSNWGCNSANMGVHLMRTDDAQILYPQSDTQDVDYAVTCNAATSCATGADQWWYFSESSTTDSQLDEFTLSDPEYAVTTDQSFKLVWGEACCQNSFSDNDGTSCADVYFIYADGCEEPVNLIWEDLMNDGDDYANKPNAVATLDVDDATLSLTIDIEADYLGLSAAHSGAEDDEYLFGTTYVIDFEDFNAHSDSIKEPGTCQNRADVFGSVSSWDEVWAMPLVGSDDFVGTTDYLSYPPGNLWTVAMSEETSCSITYSTSLTWSELTSCTVYGGSGDSYITTQDNANNITLSGTLYINVVSPYDHAADYGYYRVYQLLSQPFMIVVSKTTYVLGEVGINLLTMDMIAVYKEDEENTFRLIVLTEAAEYLELSRDTLGETSSLFQVFVPSDSSNPITSSNFRMLEPAETATSGCLGNKQYICSQLWQITADDVECTTDGIFTDFSGTYSIQFTPQCRSAADLGGDTALVTYCDGWLADHLDEITDSTADDTVLLSAGLSWRDEICDPLIFEVQFTASMQFYTDAAFSNEVADPYLFQVGEDEIYVKVTTDYPTTTFSVFSTELLNVWICTFDPLVTPDEITVDSQEGGCFDSDADDNSENFLDHIYDLANNDAQEGFELDTSSSLESNEIQFFFTVPTKVHRDTLYIHAQIEVSLSNGRRRRMLLKSRRARAEEANQIDHFVNKVGVGSTPRDDHKPLAPDHHNYPQQPYEAPQAPISPPSQPWVISLQSPWLIAVGCLLAVVLTVNILFMCYTNCVRPNGDGFVSFSRRPKYKQVAVDSEDFSEHDAINVLSN